MNTKIILASASPRRQELLAQVGLTFTVKPSDCEESVTKESPDDVVKELSWQKAWDVAAKLEKCPEEALDENEAILVIGADTVVSCDGKILGKPKSDEDAVSMLTSLQGRSHKVYTGVTILYRKEPGAEWETENFAECTKVFFYTMNEDEIRRYVDTKEPADKAGAYGIQGKCAAFIEKIEGDYNNVVGLPVGRVCLWLRQKGIYGDCI